MARMLASVMTSQKMAVAATVLTQAHLTTITTPI